MSIAADPTVTYSGTRTNLDRLYAEARRLRRAIVEASSAEDANRYRDALDEIEVQIDTAEHDETCACAGFPAGK